MNDEIRVAVQYAGITIAHGTFLDAHGNNIPTNIKITGTTPPTES